MRRLPLKALEGGGFGPCPLTFFFQPGVKHTHLSVEESTMYKTLDQAVRLPTPWCFETRDQWMTWLTLAYASRADESKQSFNCSPCRDCTPEYQAQMIKKGDCARPKFNTHKEYTA